MDDLIKSAIKDACNYFTPEEVIKVVADWCLGKASQLSSECHTLRNEFKDDLVLQKKAIVTSNLGLRLRTVLIEAKKDEKEL